MCEVKHRLCLAKAYIDQFGENRVKLMSQLSHTEAEMVEMSGDTNVNIKTVQISFVRDDNLRICVVVVIRSSPWLLKLNFYRWLKYRMCAAYIHEIEITPELRCRSKT